MNKLIQRILASKPMAFVLNSPKVSHLIGKIVLVLFIPYAYLLLCGLVFDMWLKWYHMVMFIFCSFVGLYLVAFVLVGVAIARYVQSKKSK